MRKVYNFSNNKFIADGSKFIDVDSPVKKQVIAEVVDSTKEEVRSIIKNAKNAQIEWAKLTFKARSAFMYKYRELLIRDIDELSEIIHIENGKTIEEARAEVLKAIELTEFACSIPSIISGRTQIVSRGVEVKELVIPKGVIASICPFNFPMMVPHWTIPNVLTCGNSIVVKASEQTPLTLEKVAMLLEEAGIPAGIFNIVNGSKDAVEELCENKDIDVVTFVGSSSVAKIVYKLASTNLKPCLALGEAKNFIIVDQGVNEDLVADEILEAAYGMSGQRCMAASVVVSVGENNKIINRLEEKVKTLSARTLINKKRKEVISEYLEYAQELGSEIISDGRNASNNESEYEIKPSLILHKDKEVMKDLEVFGPLLEIVEVENLGEALKLQTSSQYGNGASVYTDNGAVAEFIGNNLESGMVGVNIGVPVPREPYGFGGQKGSRFGNGEITGPDSLQLFTQKRKITTKWNLAYKKDWMS